MEIVTVKCDDDLKRILPYLNYYDGSDNDECSDDCTDDSSSSLFDDCFEYDEDLSNEDIKFLLNTLSQAYEINEGFCEDGKVWIVRNKTSDKFIFGDEDNGYEAKSIECRQDRTLYKFELDYLIEKSNIYIPQTKVIIKYSEKYDINVRYDEKWINVNDCNKRIIIARTNKKISLYDILYACQVIAIAASDSDSAIFSTKTVNNNNYNNDRRFLTIDEKSFTIDSNSDNTLILLFNI